MEVRHELRTQMVQDAFRRAPEAMVRRVAPVVAHYAQRVAASARINAAKAFSNLANSIKPSKVSDLHWEVRAGAAHARPIEEGTGPAAGRKSYMPNPYFLMAWVKFRAKIRWSGRPGGPTRRSQMREVRDRAFALALHIKQHGTKAHPFMRPALKTHEGNFRSDVGTAAIAGAREVFGQ